MTTFSAATKIWPESSHAYQCSFAPDWVIGDVPHGGYVCSAFMRVASMHFSTTLRKQKQPHTIALHLEFLRRTQVGPALFTVRDIKLGRQVSTIHVTLRQEAGGEPRDEVEGYIIQSNLESESGPTFATNWTLQPPPPTGSPSKFFVNANGQMEDPNCLWEECPALPFPNFRKATNRVRFLFPKGGQQVRASCDQWLQLRSGEYFTNESLGFVCDIFPQLIDTLVASDSPESAASPEIDSDGSKSSQSTVARYWYPTVLLNLDIKKALPAEGLPWLFVRLRAKAIKNGRYDLEIVMLDEHSEVLALSHHVVLVVDSKRNLKERSKQAKM